MKKATTTITELVVTPVEEEGIKMGNILVYVSAALAVAGILVVTHILLKKIHLAGGRR
jgi:hypothetical protein